jgi:hypothetical protein
MKLEAGKWYLRLKDSEYKQWHEGDIMKVVSLEKGSAIVSVIHYKRSVCGDWTGWTIQSDYWTNYEFSEITEEEAMMYRMANDG